jgi:hypothetical protein
MARLGKHLHFFLRKKMSEDPVWQAPLVIFSGVSRFGVFERGGDVMARAACVALAAAAAVVVVMQFPSWTSPSLPCF